MARHASRGHEGQALAWVPPRKLAGYAMPPADIPVVAALLQPDRYLVTPEPGDDDAAWLRITGARAGRPAVRRVQLRAPHCPSRALGAHWSREAARLCRAAGPKCWSMATSTLARGARHRRAPARGAAAPRSTRVRCRRDVPRRRVLPRRRKNCGGAGAGVRFRRARRGQRERRAIPGAPAMGWDGFAALREDVSLPIYAHRRACGAGRSAIARAHGAQGIAAIRGFGPLPVSSRSGVRRRCYGTLAALTGASPGPAR